MWFEFRVSEVINRWNALKHSAVDGKPKHRKCQISVKSLQINLYITRQPTEVICV